MKFIDDINVLTEMGYIVETTSTYNTIIRHEKPFTVSGDNDSERFDAVNDGGLYEAVVIGYPIGNKVPASVIVKDNSLIAECVQAVAKKLDEASNTADNNKQSEKKLKITQFGALSEGDTFFINNPNTDDSLTRECVKTGNGRYRVVEGIGSDLELSRADEDEVYIGESHMTTLSIEQKLDLVKHMPKGLDRITFGEQIMDQIDNIPGLETMSDEHVAGLVDELFDLYSK